MTLFPMQAKLFTRCFSDDVIEYGGFGQKQCELAEWRTLWRALRVDETAREEPASSISTQDSASLAASALCKAGKAHTAWHNIIRAPTSDKPPAALSTERSDADHLLEIHLKLYM